MSLLKKTTSRIATRKPPVFFVNAVEVSTNAGPDHIAVRIETPCHVCFEFRMADEFALELAGAIEKTFQKKAGLPE